MGLRKKLEQQTANFIGYQIFVEYSTCSEVHWILDIEYSSGGRQGRRVGERGVMALGGTSHFSHFYINGHIKMV